MFKRYKLMLVSLMMTIIFILSFIPCSTIAFADGKAEIAMELNSGKILYSRNATATLPMASTTKIMTGLLIAEDCNLSEEVVVADEAVGVEGSSIYLKHGEKLTIKDLLYGLMLRSGNDAATALAIHHSGSVEAFVDKMNEKAVAIGATCTHFANPSGLPNDSHYTTAKDLCTISCYAMKNPIFAEVVQCRNYTGDYKSFTNKNKILSSLEGACGIKTGYTQKAGRCLASSAKRGEMTVVCVVLNCYDMYVRSEEIINDCFNNYCVETVSSDKIFFYKGNKCSLREDKSVCLERNIEIEYQITAVEEQERTDGAVAKLKILSPKGLIFEEFLYSIEV